MFINPPTVLCTFLELYKSCNTCFFLHSKLGSIKVKGKNWYFVWTTLHTVIDHFYLLRMHFNKVSNVPMVWILTLRLIFFFCQHVKIWLSMGARKCSKVEETNSLNLPFYIYFYIIAEEQKYINL